MGVAGILIKNNTFYNPVIFVQLNILKGAMKAPTVDVLRVNTLRGTKTALIFNPLKGMKMIPILFIWVSPPGIKGT